jgi:4-oxalocrotonate tautomerase
MPIVTIQVTREGTKPGSDSVTAEEKAQLIKGVSELLLDVLNKPLEATFVVIQEVETENWGWGGLPTDVYRAARTKIGEPLWVVSNRRVPRIDKLGEHRARRRVECARRVVEFQVVSRTCTAMHPIP